MRFLLLLLLFIIGGCLGNISPVSDNKGGHSATESPPVPKPEAGTGEGGGGDNGNHGGGSKDEHHHEGYHVASIDFSRVETPFIIALWIFCASLAKIGFHMSPYLSKIFPESCLLIVVGVMVGLFLFLSNAAGDVSPLTPNVFFFYMLPPIILDAGYFMPNRLFFDHLGTILSMAVIGTIWNTLAIGGSLYFLGLTNLFDMELRLLPTFLFAALISAVDPVAVLALFEEIHVNEILYIVVFGESLLNDAVTVVLYHMFEKFTEMGETNVTTMDLLAGLASFFVVAVGGVLVGVIWGFLTAFVTRFTNHVRVIEPVFIFVMAYLAYLNAEIFHLSGILAITFCGICMKNYVVANVAPKSQTTIKYTMKMLSSSSETIIFMFLGVATVHDEHVWNTWFVVMTIIFCTVYRTIGVLVLTGIANRFRLHRLAPVEQFVMSYGGLRGAVAFALVLLIDEKVVPEKEMFVTTTIAVVYFTVFVQGMTIKPLVTLLGVKRASKRKITMNERIHERFMDHIMAGMEELMGKTGNHYLRDKYAIFKYYDRQYLKPALLRGSHAADPKILATFNKLRMQEAKSFVELGSSPSTADLTNMGQLFKQIHPSAAFLQPSESQFNLDMKELEYVPTARDMDAAKIGRMLDASMSRPYRKRYTTRYRRHAVSDKDLSQPIHLSHADTMMYMKRIISAHAKTHKSMSRRKVEEGNARAAAFERANLSDTTSNAPAKLKEKRSVSFAGLTVKGDEKSLKTDHLEEVLKKVDEEEEDGAITFQAKKPEHVEIRMEPAAAGVVNLGYIPEEMDEEMLRESSDTITSNDLSRPRSMTATENILPWHRDETVCENPQRRSTWVVSEKYQKGYSPSNTLMGIRDQSDQAQARRTAVYDVFRRRSSASSVSSGAPPLSPSEPSTPPSFPFPDPPPPIAANAPSSEDEKGTELASTTSTTTEDGDMSMLDKERSSSSVYGEDDTSELILEETDRGGPRTVRGFFQDTIIDVNPEDERGSRL
ncbi:unnamed protein product [Cyprideis torosa]|uniref:Sodium/hydrogen exchanger n=1 Tax=Cyprideis torosa TaxID=163714 RepID=A0A7R8W0F2_9CRUS|nr:unnamed protein product [Cyprideis torosa]CAG0879666.1 unnamed protein product [Cyprideis torosa]